MANMKMFRELSVELFTPCISPTSPPHLQGHCSTLMLTVVKITIEWR